MHAPILIVTDFSQAADLAMQRAVLLACQHDTELLLAHLRGSGPPDVAERLPRLAALLARRHRLPVRLLGSLDLPGLRQAAAVQAGLLVMGWPPPAARRFPWSAGVFALRLLWRLGCPLLVVRLPAAQAYGRLLVAVGPDPAPATGLLRAAAALAPGAELELFHAIDTRQEAHLLAAEASRSALHAYRRALDRHGERHLRRVADALDTRRNRLMYTLGRGDPARQILVQQEQGRAELVVTGRGLRPAWLELLLGSTAGRLLQQMHCDLLVWPERGPARPCQNAAHARNRLGTPR